MELVTVGAVAGVVALLVVAWLGRRWRASRSARRSRTAHDEARARDPPVDVGDVCEFGVTEFTDHHSGSRVAVGKVEGFVVFTTGVPADVETGDVIRATVTSFNRGHTSADAAYEGRG